MTPEAAFDGNKAVRCTRTSVSLGVGVVLIAYVGWASVPASALQTQTNGLFTRVIGGVAEQPKERRIIRAS